METVSLNPDSLKQWQDQNMEVLRYGYDLQSGDKCLDIGSYRREWADEMIKRYGVNVECFDALDQKAAWIFTGKIAMGGNYLYTSMYAEEKPNEYACVDIADYLQEEIRVLKCNIEGGEFVLLNYIIDKGLMNNIVDLQVQFHLIEGRDSKKEYADLEKRLRQTHELSWRYPFCWESWQRRREYQQQFHSV